MKTSKKEIGDLFKAWLAISIAFAILQVGFPDSISLFIIGFLVSGLTVGIGFVAHELSHKILAQKYGCLAEFRSNDLMLILAVIMSFTGFLFVAPGAVMIHGHVGIARNGKISSAGIIANLIVSLVFLLIFIMFPGGILEIIGFYGHTINAWLGLFNLIPLGNFDGIKVLGWNKKVYYTMVAFALIMVSIKYLL